MKITFPHMGYLNISGKSLLEQLGHDVILPPPITKKTLNLGVKHSPEFACLPFKINIGNYIQALDIGAEAIITAGGSGPCRFGYYCKVQKEILNDLGYDFEMFVLEPIQGNIIDFITMILKLANGFSIKNIYKAIKLCYTKMFVLDQITYMVNIKRAYEVKQGSVDKVHNELLAIVDYTNSIDDVINIIKIAYEKLNQLDYNYNINPIKIGVVGEIYTILEQYCNLDLEKKLGSMGAIVNRSIYVSEWVKQHFYLDLFGIDSFKNIKEKAKPYLNHEIGGHGIHTIGNSINYVKEGYDGIIQLAPFTCMPEITAKSILNKISKQHDIAYLPLFVDEHTGEAGIITRLEAFCDMLERKKLNKKSV